MSEKDARSDDEIRVTDLECCREIAEISALRDRLLLKGRDLPTEVVAMLIRLIEKITWDPGDVSTLEFLMEGLEFNSNLYKVEFASNPVYLGPEPLEDEEPGEGTISLGRVKGLSIVWPITKEACDKFVNENNFDWSCLEQRDYLPPDECRPAHSLFLESVVNLPVAITEKAWFQKSGIELVDGQKSARSTFIHFLDHVCEFVGDFYVSEKDHRLLPCGDNRQGVLPRFVAEVHPEQTAIGNKLVGKYQFEEVPTTTRNPEVWKKRMLDLSKYREQPMEPGVEAFALQLVDGLCKRMMRKLPVQAVIDQKQRKKGKR